MKSGFLTLLAGLCVSATAFGQANVSSRETINRLTNEDHRLMMKLLNINELRPGPSGDATAPNPANSDESKATTYKVLPNPLIFKNGTRVETPKQWEKRRGELLEDFSREIYGRMPANCPSVAWSVVEEKDSTIGGYPVKFRSLEGKVDNAAYPSIEVTLRMQLMLPAAARKPVPVVMELGWELPRGIQFVVGSGPTWQEQLLAKGWGAAVLIANSIQADNGAGLREGIIGLVNRGEARKADDWGALRAWAWGVSRAIDYFETVKAIDRKCIGIEGLSRYGKAALVAMVYEPRLAIGFIGSSGAGGAKILRRTFGEQVENLASSSEYHWFAPNFLKYAGPLRPDDLPVDAHELVALCAPRPVFISSGSLTVEGAWGDARGMFLGAAYASPVYELLGKKGLGTMVFPQQEVGLMAGDLAFRQHAGGHTTVPNWPFFIQFAARYFKK
jgi:hypothetical protein